MASELQEQENEISVKLSNTEDSDPSRPNPSDKDCMPSSCNEESLSKDSVNTNSSELSKSVASRDSPGTESLDDQIDEDAVLCGDETEKDINIDSNNIDEDELLKDTECDVVGSSEPRKSTFLTNSVDSITGKHVKITDCDSQSVADGLDKTEAVSVGNIENANLDLTEMVAVTNESESVGDTLDIGKVFTKENETGDTKVLPQDSEHSITDKRDEGNKENVNSITNGQNVESSNVSCNIQNKLMDDENFSKDGEDSHNALSMDESSTTNLMDSGDDDDDERQTKFVHVDQDSVPEEPMDIGDNAVDPFAHTSDSPERQQQSSEMETVEADDSSMTTDKPVGENSSNAENFLEDNVGGDSSNAENLLEDNVGGDSSNAENLLEDNVGGDSTTSSNEENKSDNKRNSEILTQDKEKESESANQKEHDEDFCIIPDKMPGEENSKDSSSICKVVISSVISNNMEIDLTVEKSDSSHSGEKDTGIKVVKTPRKNDSSSDAEVQQLTPCRPQRQAAKKAESQIKQAALAESADIEEIDSEVDDPDDPDDPESDIQECQQCGKVRPCKISVITYGKTNYYCGEECFARLRRFKTAHPDESEPAEKQPEVQPVPETEPVGESMAQNEENLENDKQTTVIPQDRSEFVRKCGQCSSIINADERTLSWETMDFCHEDCLGKYQMKLGSHCANCKGNVQAASLGKYCVRFGYDIKQFCCAACLEEFKKGLKVCSFCQKDISSGTEGFLAPVGDKGQFKDFCTQACMEKYEQMSSNQPPPPQMHPCDVCNNEKLVMVEVIFDKKINKLCSEVCFNAFKFVNTLSVDRCDMCKKYFDKDNSDRESFSVFYDNAPHNFCCKTCMNVYILSKRKIVPCNWCKVKKYNFDMIKRVLNTGQMLMMCSLNCLTLYQVSVNAVSSRRIKCDFCSSITQAQYHLTMSDATVRNFCSYPCVMSFQSQYSKSPITLPSGEVCPTPTGVPKRVFPRRSTPISENATSPNQAMPVISSVTSLAQNGQQTTQAPVSGNVKVNSANVGNKSVLSQQVLVKVQEPKEVRNVYVQCRPYSHTKGVSCRPHPCAKETQTENDGEKKPVFIPVPVPIYVPAPVAMYSYPLPIPVPFPLPVPVPIFVPTTRNSASGIFKEIKRIQEKIPTDPFEAELLMMAAMVAGEKKEAESSSESEDGPEAGETNETCGGSTGETSFSPEAMESSNTFGDDMLQMALKMASELDEPAVDLEAALTPATITPQTSSAVEHNEGNEEEDDQEATLRNSQDSRTRKRPLQRTAPRSSSTTAGADGVSAQKRRRSSSGVDMPLLPPPAPAPTPRIEQEKPDANMRLKYTFGVNAWRQWVIMKNTELEKMSGNNRKVKLFKPEILQLTADELNYSLCLFVKEMRKPNGTEYAPDTIYYLCLGIQQYLFENGRIDNIFTDSYYEKFTDCLDEVAKKFVGPYDDRQYIVTRVEEEHLWESKQLGAHSPHVLLSTLMFFNTKHFNLTTVEEHMQLSFSHIMKHWKRNPIQPTAVGSAPKVPGSRNVLLRFYPPQSALEAPNSRKKKVYEQAENEENPLRCPVKLYEFYLSKCPESVKTRNDVFYLQPERSCVPDSPVWYSTMALGKEPLCKMLHRIKMVKEINIALLST